MFKWLNGRSQRRGLTREQFKTFIDLKPSLEGRIAEWYLS